MENNETQNVETQNTQTQIDYESEYKKVLAERDSFKAEMEKQKGLKDKYASENADYKKKELDKLTDDEKKAKEYEDLVKSNNALAEELKAIKLEREFLSKGFTADEFGELSKNSFSAESIANLIKVRVEDAVKSTRAEFIKGTTPTQPMGKGTTNNAQEKSAFQLRQEGKQKTEKIVKL